MNAIEKRARELVKIAASAEHYGIDYNEERMIRESDVLAVIIAAITPPDGFVLVPVEPTEAMKRAFNGYLPIGRANFACRYEEMLAARPEVD